MPVIPLLENVRNTYCSVLNMWFQRIQLLDKRVGGKDYERLNET